MRALGRILVVDDEADIRTMVALRLRAVGYAVLEAEDGAEAIAIVERNPIDLILLDVTMPKKDGYEVLEILRRLPEMPAVIFCSARADSDSRVRALYGGAQDFLTKPFDTEEMLARIATAIRMRRRLEEARSDALTDPLTSLGNRRDFNAALEEEIARSRRYSRPLALASLDADHLKSVNDAFGHASGDELLKAIARAIRKETRRSDRAFRVGGDEFAVLLAEANRALSEQYCARLRQALRQERFTAGSRTLIPSASMGLAVFPEDAADGSSLVDAADRALYQSKVAREKKGA
jgi:two-component system, cell cycle response regulator